MVRLPDGPWRDRSGQISTLRLAVLALLLLPAADVARTLLFGPPAARPLTEVVHAAGRWTVYLLLVSLAVTPARQIFGWARLMTVRRMIGVASFAYVATHVAFYVADLKFDLVKVATEIWLRTYLTIGFFAVLMLAALAATSTDGMVRRLGGRRWRLLHRLAYVAAALGIVHYFLQSRLDLAPATLTAAFAVWLLLYRVIGWTIDPEAARRPVVLAALALVVGVGTGLAEAAWLAAKFGAPLSLTLAAQLDLAAMGPRPAVWALAAGLAVALAAFARRTLAPKDRRARRAPPAAALIPDAARP